MYNSQWANIYIYIYLSKWTSRFCCSSKSYHKYTIRFMCWYSANSRNTIRI